VSRRGDHLAEMRFMIEHGCASLEEARTGLAKERWRLSVQAAEAAAAKRDAALGQRVHRLPSSADHGQRAFWWERD
jgi:hypothetical protein